MNHKVEDTGEAEDESEPLYHHAAKGAKAAKGAEQVITETFGRYVPPTKGAKVAKGAKAASEEARPAHITYRRDIDRLATSVIALLTGRTEPFRYDLTELVRDAGVSNTPRRKWFNEVSDVLTCLSVIKQIGDWCIAEVEGSDVQFNPVVPKAEKVAASTRAEPNRAEFNQAKLTALAEFLSKMGKLDLSQFTPAATTQSTDAPSSEIDQSAPKFRSLADIKAYDFTAPGALRRCVLLALEDFAASEALAALKK